MCYKHNSIIKDSTGKDLGKHNITKVWEEDGNPVSIWGLQYATILETKPGTILISNIEGYSESANVKYEYNVKENWNGKTVEFIGTALSDTTYQKRY